MRTAAIALAAFALSGCSLLFQNTLRDDYTPASHGEPDCSTSRTLPVLDVVNVAVDAAAVTAFVAGDSTLSGGEVAVSVIDGLLFTTSAIVGFTRAGTCRDAIGDYWRYDAMIRAEQEEARRRELACERRRELGKPPTEDCPATPP